MKNTLRFNTVAVPLWASYLCSGLNAYAINVPSVGPPTTLWLRLSNGLILRVGVEMHDLGDWEEIGTLMFELVDVNEVPRMVSLPSCWSDIRELQKLVYTSDNYEAECGFVLCTKSGEELTVVPGADVYTIAIRAPFSTLLFTPENDFAEYIRKSSS